MEAMNLIAQARARGWGLLLVPLALQYALLTTQHAISLIEVAAAVAIVAFAPRVATKAVPFALVILGLWGIALVRDLERGSVPPLLYGIALAGAEVWRNRLVLPEAVLFLAVGAWLYLRVCAPGAGYVRALIRRAAGAVAGRPSRWALVLLPVLALAVETLGVRDWFGLWWWTLEWSVVAALVLAAGGIFVAVRAPTVAAILAATGLQVLGVYGIIIGAIWRPSIPDRYYGLVGLNGQFDTRAAAVGQGLVLLAAGVYLMPRVIREHIAGAPDRELAARAEQLTQRVQALTQTRTDAVDAAAAELPAQGPGVQRRPVHRRDPHRGRRGHGLGPGGGPQAARPPLPHRAADPADRPGARGARADGRGPVQRRDRPAAVRHREGSQQARRGHLRQAGPGALRRRQPPRPRRAGLPGILTA
jgi:hypothetical protein